MTVRGDLQAALVKDELGHRRVLGTDYRIHRLMLHQQPVRPARTGSNAHAVSVRQPAEETHRIGAAGRAAPQALVAPAVPRGSL